MENTKTVGRRKCAVARVYLKEGNGTITVNGRDYKEYFPTAILQNTVEQPFVVTNTVAKYDVNVTMDGGGVKGQAEALRHGISRSLCEINPEFRPALKKEGFLMRDPRMVERKKYGQKKARKRFQFSKR
ncbi:MAG TPA: 30S ribosomal protein S9 [Bacteroidales bacterium]|nr:30S ribosomal protein S9 [Bacteroidales bacterium]HPT02761.1 30S ribosomal protein S9 [Bacteroidales bacterium]